MQQILRCPECGREFPTQLALEEHVGRDHQGTQLTPPQYNDPAATTEFPSDETLLEQEEREPETVPTKV